MRFILFIINNMHFFPGDGQPIYLPTTKIIHIDRIMSGTFFQFWSRGLPVSSPFLVHVRWLDTKAHDIGFISNALVIKEAKYTNTSVYAKWLTYSGILSLVALCIILLNDLNTYAYTMDESIWSSQSRSLCQFFFRNSHKRIQKHIKLRRRLHERKKWSWEFIVVYRTHHWSVRWKTNLTFIGSQHLTFSGANNPATASM